LGRRQRRIQLVHRRMELLLLLLLMGGNGCGRRRCVRPIVVTSIKMTERRRSRIMMPRGHAVGIRVTCPAGRVEAAVISVTSLVVAAVISGGGWR